MDETLIIDILWQIGKGLKYLHGKTLGHRDLDPKNILLKNGQIKIIDFGFSFLGRTRYKSAKTGIGKDLYAAPEMDLGLSYCPLKADIFSYGCIMFFLSKGKDGYRIPLSYFSSENDLGKVKTQGNSDSYKELMLLCL